MSPTRCTKLDSSRRPVGRAFLAALAAILLALPAVSCSITGPSSRSDAQRELSRNRQRWTSAGIHNYEFDYQLRCGCPPENTRPAHITVRQDAVASVVHNDDGLATYTSVDGWPTVNGLFAEVQARLDEGVARITVDYDPTYGYPRSIVVDVLAMAVDDEYSHMAGNLRPLP
jgi:Family of unknown function (DUF6174)